MTFDEFQAHWTGKPVDFDGIYPNQCMDLMHQYVYDVLNLTDKTILAASQAKLVFQNFDTISGHQYFEKVMNTPTNVPKSGDIMFWGDPAGPYKDANGVQQYAGHVAIFISGDVNSFTSFDANWPFGTLPHTQQHTYDGVLGWLSPIPQQPQVTPEQLQAQAKTEADIADQCQSQLKTANKTIISQQENISEVVQQKADLQKINDDLQSKYKNEKNRTLTLSQANELLSQGHLDQTGEILDAQHEVTALTGNITHIAAAFDIPYANVKPDDLTNTILDHVKTVLAANDELQKDNNTMKLVKNAISQTITGIPSSTKQGIFKKFMSIFLTQS